MPVRVERVRRGDCGVGGAVAEVRDRFVRAIQPEGVVLELRLPVEGLPDDRLEDPDLVRFTQASSVTPLVKLSELECGTATWSSSPSKEAARSPSFQMVPGTPRMTPFA